MTALYERVGGTQFFVQLVDEFYGRVTGDPVLRPLYPDDLDDSKRWLCAFLVQYWGGPPAYSEARGHPRLRARHLPFAIGAEERDRWLTHMAAAVERSDAGPVEREELLAYFRSAADFLVNRPG